jgi:hypothetical protein
MTPEFEGDLHVNEGTWFELCSSIFSHSCWGLKKWWFYWIEIKGVHKAHTCFQGDGGVMFGAIATVVAVESDAHVWNISNGV